MWSLDRSGKRWWRNDNDNVDIQHLDEPDQFHEFDEFDEFDELNEFDEPDQLNEFDQLNELDQFDHDHREGRWIVNDD